DSGSAIVGISPLGIDLSANPTSGNFPLTVNFTATPAGGSGTYTSYAWTFGDGVTATSTTPTASHIYTAAGSYNATVQVTDSTPSNVTSAPLTITVNTPPLTASATGTTPTSGLAALTVNFNGAAGGGTPPYTYGWDFGDGSAPVTGLARPATASTDDVPGRLTALLTDPGRALPPDTDPAP